MQEYDYIVIGSGAGGGTIAHKLAPSGKRILILERGDFLPSEKENWSTQAVFRDGRYNADETWLDGNEKDIHPATFYFVGGNTKMYGSALFRFKEKDFEELVHEDGISPAWPITYQDLAPYYLEAEKLFSVHGERGSDPIEPPESAPFFFPPLPHEPRIQDLYDCLVDGGTKVFPLPLGVRLPEERGIPNPVILDRFDGYPDPLFSKADAQVCTVDPALNYSNVTLKVNRRVNRLIISSDGQKIEEVVADYQGSTERYRAKVFIVSCGAINSAALLLKSANSLFPNGLANSSDQVGRNYMMHNNSAVIAISSKPNPSRFGKTLAINDYYFGDERFKYPMGHIQMLGKQDDLQIQDIADTDNLKEAKELSSHSLDFWLTTEDLPRPENRVTLTEEGQIKITYHPNNLRAHRELKERLRQLLVSLDCEQSNLHDNNRYFQNQLKIEGVAHQSGTAKMGNDPSSSVVNEYCKAHDHDNLYIVDSSFFVSSTASNPTLTIIAMALRVGEYLLNQK